MNGELPVSEPETSQSTQSIPQFRSPRRRLILRTADRTSWFGALFVAFIFIIDSGVPSLLLQTGAFVQGRMIIAAITVLSLAIPVFRRVNNFGLGQFRHMVPILLLLLIVVESTISNIFIFHYDASNFAPSLYLLVPIISFYLLMVLEISSGDIIWGFIISALFAVLIVIIDSFERIPQLIELRRMSVFDSFGNTNRLVLLKESCVTALVLLASNLFGRGKAISRYLTYSLLFALIAYPVFVTFESRFAMLSSLISIVLFVVTANLRSVRRTILILIGFVAGAPGAWFALEKYIAPLLSSDFATYAATNNVSIRVDSMNYYFGWFQQTFGVGIGHMSTSPAYDNILSSVVDKAYNLNDLGIYAALFQFGVIGFVTVVSMTGYLIWQLFRLGYSQHPRAVEFHMLACYVVASLLQVIPTNNFTLTYSCLYGSTLWYLMCRGRWEAAGDDEAGPVAQTA